ncbi:MAG: putative cysteine desulfurase [Microgenomates bacterium OLB23]|nr:MAG: putative cysteine desulfurase [Microgenomates bacterium OLB23]
MSLATELRKDFPILSNYPDMVYFDSTATSLKPRVVIDAISHYYTHLGANIHRGIYDLSEAATEAFEETRAVVADFINANVNEVLFTRGTTESINLLIHTIGEQLVQEGDEVATTLMEHHANFVPWQQLALRKKAAFKVVTVDENADLDMSSLKAPLQKKTKLFACTYVSNVSGIVNPIADIIKTVRAINPHTIIVIDAAQAVPHISIDVAAIDCDFLAFSAHKMCGPTGVGVLYGKKSHLQTMQPFMFGGDMIAQVAIEQSTFQEPPYRFEAGTPHISGIIAFKESIKYLNNITYKAIKKHEEMLMQVLISELRKQCGASLKIIGQHSVNPRVALAAMYAEGSHPHDLADILNADHICVRAGHHCAMPLHKHFNIPASTRASLYFYNTEDEVQRFAAAFSKALRMFI